MARWCRCRHRQVWHAALCAARAVWVWADERAQRRLRTWRPVVLLPDEANPKPGLGHARAMRDARHSHASLADAVCMSMALDPAKRFASAEALGRATLRAHRTASPPCGPLRLRLSVIRHRRRSCRPAGSRTPQGFLGLAPARLESTLLHSGLLGRIWNTHRLLLAACFLCRKSFCRFSSHGSKPKLPDVASRD